MKDSVESVFTSTCIVENWIHTFVNKMCLNVELNNTQKTTLPEKLKWESQRI